MKKRKKTFPTAQEMYDGLPSVASANECTGLMPTQPESEQEARSYAQLYDAPAAKNRKQH